MESVWRGNLPLDIDLLIETILTEYREEFSELIYYRPTLIARHQGGYQAQHPHPTDESLLTVRMALHHMNRRSGDLGFNPGNFECETRD